MTPVEKKPLKSRKLTGSSQTVSVLMWMSSHTFLTFTELKAANPPRVKLIWIPNSNLWSESLSAGKFQSTCTYSTTNYKVCNCEFSKTKRGKNHVYASCFMCNQLSKVITVRCTGALRFMGSCTVTLSGKGKPMNASHPKKHLRDVTLHLLHMVTTRSWQVNKFRLNELVTSPLSAHLIQPKDEGPLAHGDRGKCFDDVLFMFKEREKADFRLKDNSNM